MSDSEEVLPSKPSKVSSERSFLSRVFSSKKKSRTLSKHDLSRSEAEFFKKIQGKSDADSKKRSSPKPQEVEETNYDAPLLNKLTKALDCGLAEPLAVGSRESFTNSIVQARDALADARKIYRDNMNANSAEVFVSLLSSSGDILKASGKKDESLEFMLEAVQICRRHPALKDQLACTLNDLGLLYCDMKKFKEAKMALQEAYSLLLEIYGDVHPDVAACSGNLGIAYSGCKENSLSSDSHGQSIKMMDAIYGKDHEYTLQQRGLLGVSLITAGDASEAKKELRAVLTKMEQLRHLPFDYPLTQYIRHEFQVATSLSAVE